MSIGSRSSFVPITVAALLAAAVPAQFSSARSTLEKVRSALGNVRTDKERLDALNVAKPLHELCGSLMDQLSNCAREFAESGSGFTDERGRVRRAAMTVRGQAEVTRLAVDAWRRKLESSENAKTECENVASQTNELVKQWSEFERRIDETRRWLADGLREWTARKDRVTQDARPIAEAQNAAWARVHAAQRADNRADEEHDRALERVVAAEIKENEACERYRNATASAGARPEEVWPLREQWNRAVRELAEAGRAAGTALQAAQVTREELNRAYQQLGTTVRDMEAFTNATDANTIVANYNSFVRWSEMFTKEFS